MAICSATIGLASSLKNRKSMSEPYLLDSTSSVRGPKANEDLLLVERGLCDTIHSSHKKLRNAVRGWVDEIRDAKEVHL
jgi:hypothetical protein